MKTNFEDYLKEIHAEDYHGTDDAMPDSFDAWLKGLDTEEVMQYADEAMSELLASFDRISELAGKLETLNLEAIAELQKIKEMAS